MGTRYRIMVEKLEEMHPGWELDIQPPPEGPVSGAARQAGGHGLIRYAFSGDEQKPYLEFYSWHRIWGDLRNRALVEELEAAGLLSGGPVPASFVLNAAIATGVVDTDEGRSDPDERDCPTDHGDA